MSLRKDLLPLDGTVGKSTVSGAPEEYVNFMVAIETLNLCIRNSLKKNGGTQRKINGRLCNVVFSDDTDRG